MAKGESPGDPGVAAATKPEKQAVSGDHHLELQPHPHKVVGVGLGGLTTFLRMWLEP